MLNRRHLRIKALQTLFACYSTEEYDIKSFEKYLNDSIEEVYAMYAWVLTLLIDVADYAEEDADKEKNKFANKGKKVTANLALKDNAFIGLLRENAELKAAVKKYKIDWSFDPEIAEHIFYTLKKKPEYAEYLAGGNKGLEDDKEIIKFIFRKLVLKDAQVIQALEDRFINYQVDHEVMKGMVAKTIKTFTQEEGAKNKLIPVITDPAEDTKFVKDLFKLTVKGDKTAAKLIDRRMKNWETERIALMDSILMKMAITEFMNFTSIPVKVTLNEYLELSKEFSTPKSSVFINGILDNVLADLKKDGKLVKTGRGLIDA